MSKFRGEVNGEVLRYWAQAKARLQYTPCTKKRVPRFTRHNGHTLVRLSRTGWRYPKSCQGNRAIMTVPKIGYKNASDSRGMFKAYGMKPKPVHNQRELRQAHAQGYLPLLGRTLGARSRARILAYARGQAIPLCFRR